jgi:hypothetical protein
MTAQSLNRCNIRMLLSLASLMTRDIPLDAELPENAAAAERLFRICSLLQPSHIPHGEEAVQSLRHSRCDLVRTSIEHMCSSFFSDECAVASTQRPISSAWDASWLASVIAACGHEWDLAGAERALSLLGLQLQRGCAADVGICASLPEGLMLRSALMLMQKRNNHISIERIARIALQLFCRRASVDVSAAHASYTDGLDIAASLASLCAVFCERNSVEQLSLLLCMFTCSLMQQLQLQSPDPHGTVTAFFDEHKSASCWRGLCHAASRSNLSLAAAAGFSSGAVLLAQLLRVGASFAAALPLLQAAPAYAFAAFSPQFEFEQKIITPNVKGERHQDADVNADTGISMLQPSLQSAAVVAASVVADFAESNGLDRSDVSSSFQAKRQLDMDGPEDRSSPAACSPNDSLPRDAGTKSNGNSPSIPSLLPKKRTEPSLSPAARYQHTHHSLQRSPASIEAKPAKPLSWLAQFRTQKATAEYDSDDFTRLHSVKYEPVQSASAAILRIASAASQPRSLQANTTGSGVGTLKLASKDQAGSNSKADCDSDDDIVALS